MPHYLHFEVILNNPKSLMTLMTVTLMTGFRGLENENDP